MGLENGADQKYKDLIGARFGFLVVRSVYKQNGRTWCVCDCDCKNTKTVRKDHLTSKRIVSCGCYGKTIIGARSKTHGMSGKRIYRIWKGMRNRCENINVPNYNLYGGRGISVCDEWHSFKVFNEWALSNGYRDDLSIDRIDNNGNYCPDNCRWADRKEQARNRRSNITISCNGSTKLISDWDNDIGSRKRGRVRARLNAGWSVEKAVTTPVHGPDL